jgi:nitrite reductase/ring-hydroxylating ferredoxin subunit
MSNSQANNRRRPTREGRLITVGRTEDVPVGRGGTVELADGGELALYHTSAGFYAIENFCPHRGAPLANGSLEGFTLRCSLHDWCFDVRTGACLSHAGQDVERYEVTVEAGEIKILV